MQTQSWILAEKLIVFFMQERWFDLAPRAGIRCIRTL